MKRYRVTFRPVEGAGAQPKTEEVLADRWKVDEDLVVMYRNEGGSEIKVWDIPKQSVVRVIEVA